MRKLFLNFSKDINFYWPCKYGNLNGDLKDLWFSFDSTYYWIQIDDDEDGWVTIWDNSRIKDQKDRSF